jgi:pilus assembly protein CpaF
MDCVNPLCEFLENSFLKPVLCLKGLNDISYNGEDFYSESVYYGRKKEDVAASNEEVGAFLRQIANLSERQFSYLNPILDVSFGRYRLCACFLSLTRVYDRKAYSFSLRIERKGSILEKDESFFPGESKSLLLTLLKEKRSIVIGGETGSGKTELQKYLLLQLEEATRVLVIDNVEELELIRGRNDIDLTTWVIDPNGKGGSASSLIKAALRFNPDYLVLAEARGEEMWEALCCAMSGHPLILTVHSSSLESMPSRLARLSQMRGNTMVYSDLLNDVEENFSVFVLVRKRSEGGGVKRSIEKIGIMKEGKMQTLFQRQG